MAEIFPEVFFTFSATRSATSSKFLALCTRSTGAMPVLHRWWGNPMFSWMARLWFKAPIHDIHCGLRGFRLDAWQTNGALHLYYKHLGFEMVRIEHVEHRGSGALFARPADYRHGDGPALIDLARIDLE